MEVAPAVLFERIELPTQQPFEGRSGAANARSTRSSRRPDTVRGQIVERGLGPPTGRLTLPVDGRGGIEERRSLGQPVIVFRQTW